MILYIYMEQEQETYEDKYKKLKEQYERLQHEFIKKENEDTELVIKLDKKNYDLSEEINKLKFDYRILKAKLLYAEFESEELKK